MKRLEEAAKGSINNIPISSQVKKEAEKILDEIEKYGMSKFEVRYTVKKSKKTYNVKFKKTKKWNHH